MYVQKDDQDENTLQGDGKVIFAAWSNLYVLHRVYTMLHAFTTALSFLSFRDL